MNYFPNECCHSASACKCGLPGSPSEDRKEMTYDERSYELAEVFLSDDPKNSPANRHRLAQVIQRAIEDEIEYGLTPPLTSGYQRDEV
jgi:hypothetical protein